MNKRITPAMCGRGICGRTICGQTEKREYGDRYLGYSEYGENPKFNLQTKRMLYVLPGLSVGAENRRVSVSLVYDSDMKDGITALCAGMPSGWKLSAQEFLVTDGLDDNGRLIYKYIDGNGYVHKFVPFERDSSRCYDTDGLGLILTPSEHSIEDMYGNVLKFTNSRLTEKKSGYTKKATVYFVYDSAGRLTKMYDNRSAVGSTPLRGIEFDYDGGELTAIRALGYGTLGKVGLGYADGKYIVSYASGKSVEVTYDTAGKAELFRETETGNAIKVSYGIPAPSINVIRISEGNVSGGKFVEKRYIESGGSHVQELDFTTVCEAMLKNEKGVCTLIQLDRRGRIIGEYEYDRINNAYKTMEPERGVIVTPSSGETANETINGKQAVNFTNSLDLPMVVPQKSGEEPHRYFALTFHLRSKSDAKRLRARLKYKFVGNLLWRTSEAEIDASASYAWQRVSIPIDVGAYIMNPIYDMKLELYVPGRETDVTAEAGDFRIASSPFTSVKIFGNNNEMDIRDLKTVYVTYSGNNAGTEQVAYTTDRETEYITECDILGSVMEIISPRSAPRGSDLILEDGKRRIASMDSALFTNKLPGESDNDAKAIELKDLYSSGGGYIIDTVSADDKSRTRKKVTFSVGGIERIYTTVTVCANDKTFRTAEDGDIITKGETMTERDIYGNILQKSDAYGVREANIYDENGTLKTSKIISPDGKEIITRTVTTDETSGKITSVHMPLTGMDLTFDEPFVTLREAYSKIRGSNGVYSRTGAKKAYGYDSQYDKLLLVDEYDRSTKKSRITYTYDGNVMTVSDGASEYKVENDYANGKTKYYAEDNGTYSLVEEVSDGETKYYRGSATDTVTVSEDEYGKAESVSTDGKSANYVYVSSDADGNELGSGYAKILTGVTDGYSGRVYEVKRDNAYNECRHTVTKIGESTPVIDIRQVRSNVTEYTVPDHPVYRTTIEYDAEKTVEPRITGVKYEVENINDSYVPINGMCMKYEYDALGRVKRKYVANNGVPSTLPVHYDCEYGSGEQALLKTTQTVRAEYEQGLNRQKTKMTEERTYHEDGRLNTAIWRVSGESDGYAKNYSEGESYVYDKFGRLTNESNIGFGVNREYKYEGKRFKSITESGSTKYMQYDSRGRLTKITNDEAGTYVYKSYAYDNYGNRISDSKRTYTWTRGRLLASAGSTTYGYDYTGERCRKVDNGSTTEYYYDNGRLISESGDKPMIYYYDTEGLIGARMDGSMYKVVRDISGSVRYLVDIEGRIAAQYKYDAHGVCKVYDGKNAINTSSTFIGNKFPIRWKGYYYDTETGLYYNVGRYYDPEIGKYLDACGVEEAIAEEQLDRNGIMCDNILELMPYICSVLIGLAKDPTSGESDGATNGWDMPWWVKILIGLGTVFVGALVTAFTAGTGISAVAAFGSALLSSTVQVGISAGISAGIGGIMSLISGDGFLDGLLDGLVDGVMWGGIFAGGAQILSGAFNIAARLGARTGVKGGIRLGNHVKILSPNNLSHFEQGGTLLKIGNMARHGWNIRFDIGIKTYLHINIELGKNYHIFIGKYIAGIIGGFY